MDNLQELRGQVRQLLNDSLVFATANRNDLEVKTFTDTKAAVYREILDLISNLDN